MSRMSLFFLSGLPRPTQQSGVTSLILRLTHRTFVSPVLITLLGEHLYPSGLYTPVSTLIQCPLRAESLFQFTPWSSVLHMAQLGGPAITWLCGQPWINQLLPLLPAKRSTDQLFPSCMVDCWMYVDGCWVLSLCDGTSCYCGFHIWCQFLCHSLLFKHCTDYKQDNQLDNIFGFNLLTSSVCRHESQEKIQGRHWR